MGVEVGGQLSRSFGSFYGHPQPWPMDYLKGIDTPEGYEALTDIDEAHVMYYGTTEHSIQCVGVYVNVHGKRFVNEGLGSSLVNQEVMQQPMARAYLILDEALRELIRQTPFFNAAVIGGDRIDNMIERGMTVVQADTLEELGAKIVAETADGVAFNANAMLRTIGRVQRGCQGGHGRSAGLPPCGHASRCGHRDRSLLRDSRGGRYHGYVRWPENQHRCPSYQHGQRSYRRSVRSAGGRWRHHERRLLVRDERLLHHRPSGRRQRRRRGSIFGYCLVPKP